MPRRRNGKTGVPSPTAIGIAAGLGLIALIHFSGQSGKPNKEAQPEPRFPSSGWEPYRGCFAKITEDPEVLDRIVAYQGYMKSSAQTSGVDQAYLNAVALSISGFGKEPATAGRVGMFHMIEGMARFQAIMAELSPEALSDPSTNTLLAAKTLSYYNEKYGDMEKAYAALRLGESATALEVGEGWKSALPDEISNEIKEIAENWEKFIDALVRASEGKC